MSQKTITAGTSGSPASLDINFGNAQDNVTDLYGISSAVGRITNTGRFKFDDHATYTSLLSRMTLSAGADGLNIATSGDDFLPTGKIINSTFSKITLSGKCVVNNTAYFGIGIGSADDWGGCMYRGSTGDLSLLNYGLSTFKSSTNPKDGATYAVGDTVTIEISFSFGVSFVMVAVNGVFTPKVQLPSGANVDSGGEIHICIRGASTWEDINIELTKVGSGIERYFVAKNGSDDNDGSTASPFLTITKATTLAMGICPITVGDGDYFDETFSLSQGIKISANADANVRLIYGTRFSSASLVDGYTRVYQVSYATTLTSYYVLWQHDVPDKATAITVAKSHPLHRGATHRLQSTKCTWLSSLEALEASDSARSYFYWSAGVLYFTIVDGSNLTDNPIVIPTIDILGAATVGAIVDMCNINFLYKPVSLSGTRFNVMECSNMYGITSYGWQYGDCVAGVFTRCRAGGHNYRTGIGGDGFNGTNTLTNNNYSVINYDPWAHDNFDDGDSLHTYGNSSIYGGLVENNGSGVTAASGGRMSIYNGVVRDNTGTGISAQGTPPAGIISTGICANSTLVENNGTNCVDNTGDDSIILINCISVGGAFPTAGLQKYNCVDIP